MALAPNLFDFCLGSFSTFHWLKWILRCMSAKNWQWVFGDRHPHENVNHSFRIETFFIEVAQMKPIWVCTFLHQVNWWLNISCVPRIYIYIFLYIYMYIYIYIYIIAKWLEVLAYLPNMKQWTTDQLQYFLIRIYIYASWSTCTYWKTLHGLFSFG